MATKRRAPPSSNTYFLLPEDSGTTPSLITIPGPVNDFEAFYRLIGGGCNMIERVGLGNGLSAIVDEDGHMRMKRLNQWLLNNEHLGLVGGIIISGQNFKGLTTQQVAMVRRVFIRGDGGRGDGTLHGR